MKKAKKKVHPKPQRPDSPKDIPLPHPPSPNSTSDSDQKPQPPPEVPPGG